MPFSCAKSSERLKACRGESNLSQTALASEAGINKQSVINYENAYKHDIAGMRVETLYYFAKALGVSADYLLGLSDCPSSDNDLKTACEYTGLSAKAVQLLHDFFVEVVHCGAIAEVLKDAPYQPQDTFSEYLCFGDGIFFESFLEICDAINENQFEEANPSSVLAARSAISDNNITTVSKRELAMLRIEHAASNLATVMRMMLWEKYEKERRWRSRQAQS